MAMSVSTGSKYEDLDTITSIIRVNEMLENDFNKYYKEILENYNAVAGYLYTADDLAKLEREGRPTSIYNTLLPIVNSLTGYLRYNQVGVQAIPRKPDDTEKANMITDTLNWVHQIKNDLNYNVSLAFLDAIVGRIGWLRHDFGYQEDPLGSITINRHDPFRIAFDPTFKKRDLSDCRYLRDSGWYSPEELIQIFGTGNEELKNEIVEKSKLLFGKDPKNKRNVMKWSQRLYGVFKEALRDKAIDNYTNVTNFNQSEYVNFNQSMLKVIEWHERKLVKGIHIYEPVTNNLVNITSEVITKDGKIDQAKIEILKQSYKQPLIKENDIVQLFQTIVIPGMNIKVSEAPYPIQNGNFKFTPILCYDFHPNIMQTKSVIDNLKDPARSFNKRKSTILEIIMRMGNPEWLVEEGALDEHEDDFSNNRIGGVKKLKPNGLNRIRRVEPGNFPAGLDRFAQEDLEMHDYISNVSKNTRGFVEAAGESGALFDSRVRQSEITQEWVNDNVASAIKQISRNTLAYIQFYMAESRLIRLEVQDEPDKWVELNKKTINGVLNDVTVGEYDIDISKSPFGREAKDKEFQKLIFMNQQLANINPKYIDIISLIKASGSMYTQQMIEKIKNIDEQEQLQAQQQIQQMQQAQQMQQGAGEQVTDPITDAKLQLLTQNAELEAGLKTGKAKADMQIKQIKAQQEVENLARNRMLGELKIKNQTNNIKQHINNTLGGTQ